MALSLESEVTYLKGVGPKGAASLATLGIQTVRDLLYYPPRRHVDRSNTPPIHLATPGEYVTVRGRVVAFDVRAVSGGRVLLKAVLKDETGSIHLTWFNQPWLRGRLEHYRGELMAYGLVKDTGLAYEISGPDIEYLDDEEDDGEEFARLTPVYATAKGIPQAFLRRAAKAAVDYGVPLLQDPLPEDVRVAQRLQRLRWSVRESHFPESVRRAEEAFTRLKFDEFLARRLGAELTRRRLGAEPGIAFPIEAMRRGEFPEASDLGLSAGIASKPLDEQLRAMFPFELTGAQRRVVEEIFADMGRSVPMNRLVQGDVGAGKTAVAACAIVACVRSGYQAAMMAPTEILAEQHWRSLSRMLAPLGIGVELLVGKLTPSQKKKARDRVEAGEVAVSVGTHALVTEGMRFARLGLTVVDEQHRFGVEHRANLRQKGVSPDMLMMTATPIPRTLQMLEYGSMEQSIIDELPPGRKPIKTKWRPIAKREETYEQVKTLLQEGRQAFVVCPMVSESEKMLAQAATEHHAYLSRIFEPEYRVALLHGQMKSKEKEATMDAFRRNATQILVATTVIEVGVDVPNATVMIVEDANRFGLAQLHQLRGRVGRGAEQSFCILIADASNPDARERLDTMVATTDGFEIAEKDLELRGGGVLEGKQQSGKLDFLYADPVRDRAIFEKAAQAAAEIVERDPTLEGHPGLLELARAAGPETVLHIS